MLKQRHKALMLWAKAKDYQAAQAVTQFTLENSSRGFTYGRLQARIRTADSLQVRTPKPADH